MQLEPELISNARERLAQKNNEKPAKIALVGARELNEFARFILESLPDTEIHIFNPSRTIEYSREFEFGIRCKSLCDLIKEASSFSHIVLCSRWFRHRRPIEIFLNTQNIKSCSADLFISDFLDGLDTRFDDWRPTIIREEKKLTDIGLAFSDEYSRSVLKSVLEFRLSGDLHHIRKIWRPYEALYFDDNFKITFGPEKTFVDCGASIGESLWGFMDASDGKFRGYIGIDPDKHNKNVLMHQFQILESLGIPQSKLRYINAATGSKNGYVNFNHTGHHGGQIYEKSDHKTFDIDSIESITIDSLELDGVCIFKLDVEGAELASLKGATETIKRLKPTIIVSVYHKPIDLIEIYEFLNSVQPDYKFGLRHNTHIRWDTCLYAY
jgi:FkbM family methyltransferase|tara:strand:- start:1653 stop:2798 length:1146 start_codon:yes stop_codon:yes gene_type:complete